MVAVWLIHRLKIFWIVMTMICVQQIIVYLTVAVTTILFPIVNAVKKQVNVVIHFMIHPILITCSVIHLDILM
jgi:hypothetical protein